MTISPDTKRMLEISRCEKTGKTKVAINYSSISILQECSRKGYYTFVKGLTGKSTSPALVFGKAIHQALEVWYQFHPSERAGMGKLCRESQSELLAGNAASLKSHEPCARCNSIYAFLTGASDLSTLEPGDARSVENGLAILNGYFDYYEKDPFVVHKDASGVPLVERSFEFTMHEDPFLIVTYHGQIDVIMRQIDNDKLICFDHKTTASLSSDFFKRVTPNFQYTGYYFGARETLGVDPEAFIVNGIQVAKTIKAYRRITTSRREEDFDELKAAILFQIRGFLPAWRRRLEKDSEMLFPMSTPNPCTNYGGCTFHSLCSVPRSLRGNIEVSQFQPRATVPIN